MKKILFILCILVSQLALADGRDSTNVRDTSRIPAKWKNESIIILDYSYTCDNDYTKTTEEFKGVYYIRDNWGLEAFSQLTLPSDLGDDASTLGTIYKKNGTKVAITSDNLIPKKERIELNTSFSRKSTLSIESESGQKLAIPALEVGDILELSYKTTRSSVPQILVLINKYPMLRAHYSVSLWQPTSTLYYSDATYAGTEKRAVLMNCDKTPTENSASRIVMDLDSVDKYKEEILNDDIDQVPYVLIRRVSARSQYDMNFTNLEGSDERLVQLTFVNSIFYKGDGEQKHVASRIKSALSKKYSKVTDTIAYLKDAYYLYRDIIGGDYVFSGYNVAGYKSDEFFVNVMSRVLEAKDINFKVFVSQSDHFGSINKVNDFVDFKYGIVLPSANFYLFNPLYNLEPGLIPSSFENRDNIQFTASRHFKKTKFRTGVFVLGALGAISYIAVPPVFFACVAVGVVLPITAYAVGTAGDKRHQVYGFRSGRFPSTPAASNQIVSVTTVKSFNAADNTVNLELKQDYYGRMKTSEAGHISYHSYTFYRDDANPYDALRGYHRPVNKDLEKEKTEETKLMKKMFTSDLAEVGYSVKKVDSYKIDKTNFFEQDKPLGYSVDFTAKDLIWSSGDYIMLNAGQLIGYQTIVPEKSKERTQDFNLPYKKQYDRTVIFPVPDGYAVQNLSEFNVSKETAAGKFIAKATLEGNKVVIKTVKTFGFQFYDKEDAKDIYDFLQAAAEYHNKNLILRKK